MQITYVKTIAIMEDDAMSTSREALLACTWILGTLCYNIFSLAVSLERSDVCSHGSVRLPTESYRPLPHPPDLA